MKTNFFSVLALGAAFLTLTPLHAEPALAGHSSLTAQSLDSDAVKAILLGKRVTLGPTRVVIVIAKTSVTQDAFLQTHLGMTTSQFQNHWRRLFMTGGGSAPKIVETEAEACKLAAETPGAVVISHRERTTGLVILSSN